MNDWASAKGVFGFLVVTALLACSGGSSTPGAGGDGGGGGSGATTISSASGSTSGGSTSSGSTSSGETSGGSTSSSGGGLNPGLPPGSNFDLSLWELQEPVGSPGSPTTISPAQLTAGYHDAYFYTDPNDGAMTFWDPENGVMTANSNYPRSELREMTTGTTVANWPIAGTNTLSATLAVTQVPDHVCIGQIHIGSAIQAGLAASTKPLLELYYYANGNVALGLESGPAGSEGTPTVLTNVPLGTKLSYTIVKFYALSVQH